MKSGLKILGLLLLTSNYLVHSQPLVSDFKVSTNNSPSTIIQNEPKLFFNDSLGFLLTWTDFREGEEGVFAQRFDQLGNKIGSNFKIYGNENVVYKDPSQFLSIKSVYYDSWFWGGGFYSLIGRISNPPSMLNDTLYLGSGSLPWCGTGWLGISHTTFFQNNKFRCFFSNGGRVIRTDFNSSGSYLDQTLMQIFTAAWVNAVKLKDEDYSLFWFNGHPDSGKIGLYGNFYNSADSVYSEKVLIASDSIWGLGGWVSFYSVPNMSITSVNDTLYQIFWVNTDSLNRNLIKIFYCKYDRRGNKVGETLSIPLDQAKTLPYYFELTNSFNNKFSLVISASPSYTPASKFTSIYDFYNDGSFTGNFTTDTSFDFRFDKKIFKYDNDKFFVGYSDGKDVYRATLQNYSLSGITKINDDLSGSNESNPIIIKKDENTNLIVWQDEVSLRGRFVGVNGNLIGEEKVIDASAIQLMPNGNGVGLWKKDLENNSIIGGFVYFDNQLNELRRDTFLTAGIPLNLQYGTVTYRVLNDSSIVIIYRIPGQTRARSVDANGTVKKDILLSTDASTYYIRILKHDNDNIYLNWNGLIQLSDNGLNLKGLQFKGFMDLYFGDHKYMQIRYMKPEYAASYHEGFIFSVFGDTLKKNIRFIEGATDFSVFEVNSQLFYIGYNWRGKYYVRAYKSDGTPLLSPVVIHDNTKSSKKNFYLFENSERTYCVWADNRNGDFDIYCSIYRTTTLTDMENESVKFIPNDFRLYQNYPNPFNPVTNIKYQIPKSSYVTLKVFDILGREVAVLVDEIKEAGIHNYPFSIMNYQLSSGIYFCQLKAGNYIETQKMVFQK